MHFGIAGKVLPVTGASRGIRRAIAQALAAEGCRLAICARGEEGLEQAAAELQSQGSPVLAFPVDVTVPAQAETLTMAILEAYDSLDILVNNVGGSRGSTLEQTSEAQWQEAFGLNLFAAVRLARLALPAMRRQSWGRIVNISSIYGRETGGGMTYNASKAALISFTKALARELAPEGITVNSVAPGSLLFPGGSWDRRATTESARRGITRDAWIAEFVGANIPAGRFGTPEEIAAVVAFLASHQARWVTGAIINVDGGQSRSGI